MNDGCKAILAAAPDANVLTAAVAMTAGARQAPFDAQTGIRIVDFVGNGASSGKAVRIVDKKTLDAALPDWQDDGQTAVATDVMVDPEDPLVYWCYPPNNGSGQMRMKYQAHITDMTPATTTFVLNAIWTSAAIDYVLYRAFNKDSEYGDPKRAEYYFQKFSLAVGLKEGADKAGEAPTADSR
jgi:hypothetical protein